MFYTRSLCLNPIKNGSPPRLINCLTLSGCDSDMVDLDTFINFSITVTVFCLILDVQNLVSLKKGKHEQKFKLTKNGVLNICCLFIEPFILLKLS